MYITSLHGPMPSTFVYTLFVCHFVSPYEFGKGIVCVSLLVSVLKSTCLPLVVSPYTFTEKFVCDKINLVLSVIGIITVSVELL